MLIADLDGTIVAANTIDYKGKPVNTSALVGRSVNGEEWFEQSSSGRIGPGETYFSDLEIDALSAEVTGERGLALNFSAPIYSESGEIVRVWSNRASWKRITGQIVEERSGILKDGGAKTIEFSVLNRSGFVIEDYDADSILKLNLAEAGLEAARKVVAGESGYTIEVHERLGIEQINGYAASKGALGFAGYGWGVLGRQQRSEAVADASAIGLFVLIIVSVVAVLIALLALWIANGISRPIAETADVLDAVADGDYTRRLELHSEDEVGRLAASVNGMTAKVEDAMQQVQNAADRETAQAEEQKEKVREMLAAVDAVAAGDYSKTISATGSSSIGQLGEALTRFFFEKQSAEQREREVAESDQEQQRQLRAKVDEMLGAVTAASDGDLKVAIEVNGDDAAGRMAEGLRIFLGRLRETISDISLSSTQLSSDAGDLSTVSSQMKQSAQTTSTQAAVVSSASDEVNKNVQVVASSIEEMTASIREIARSSSDAARIASQAVSAADSANETIRGLGDAGTEIGNVVKVITSIAEQTNLLALNATIEAARAGEAGKGFAVVANEVKELAKQTAQATEDIANRIEAIQSGATGAVTAIGEVGVIINQINDISNTIASAVQQQEATTNEISRNISDAARGSGEIAANITGVASAAGGTATGANNVLQSAQSLAGMSDQLHDIVGKFKF